MPIITETGKKICPFAYRFCTLPRHYHCMKRRFLQRPIHRTLTDFCVELQKDCPHEGGKAEKTLYNLPPKDSFPTASNPYRGC